MRQILLCFMLLGLAASDRLSAQTPPADPELRWWKGNLHTHSLWSDGDDYPEMIAEWYKTNGYHFLALSDHNVLSEGPRWSDVAKNKGGRRAFEDYVERWGTSWVETKEENGALHARLKPLNEFRALFEAPQEFLLIQSEEISDRRLSAPVHLNVANVRDFIQPRGGESVYEVMQNNVNAVLEQREKTGQPMLPHLNHPNFGWGVTAEELMRVKGENFFEVYNGHPSVRNEGDATHASTERMWDIILAQRLAELRMEPMLGVAVDDSHHYHREAPNLSISGRGWVMVRATHLTPEKIILAMEAGDFYATTGVEFEKLERSENALEIAIATEPGVTYKIEFIGTKKTANLVGQPIRTDSGENLRVTHRYSDDIGGVLKTIEGSSGRYELTGDELYARARVTSSKAHPKAAQQGELEMAWTQPLVDPAVAAAIP